MKNAAPLGFQFGGARCGLKNKRKDVGIIYSDRPAIVAGVLTTNQVRAACVDYTRTALEQGFLRGVVVNSGNANCCTGEQGRRDTATMGALAAAEMAVDPGAVAVSSTGIIGHLLDMSKVERGIHEAWKHRSDDPAGFIDAILTTDLVEKWALRNSDSDRVYVPGDALPEATGPKVFGVAKGSGMMSPNMATMLSYVVTDFDASELDLNAILRRVCDKSFNSMTVDGDTSTNDMLLVLANGASGVRPTSDEFEAALLDVCVSLARQIARDGEGATKLVEVRVTGTSDPKLIARTIANSPLVKTAMFGCDPNWGRILMAAGRAGVRFDPLDIRLTLTVRDEQHVLFEHGAPAAFDPKRVSAALKSDVVGIDLELGAGETATIYTCDFGYGYVRINAEYHT